MYQNSLTRKKLKENLAMGETLKYCLLSGLFTHVAFLTQKKTYKTFQEEQICLLYPGTTMQRFPHWVVYLEFVVTSKNYLRTVTEVQGEWLQKQFPEIFDPENEDLKKDSKKALEKVKKGI